MLPNSVQSLSRSITWDFQLAASGSIARYGSLGSTRYKQYLPGGIEVPGSYPPRPIGDKVYQLAKRQYDGSRI